MRSTQGRIYDGPENKLRYANVEHICGTNGMNYLLKFNGLSFCSIAPRPTFALSTTQGEHVPFETQAE
jgi:hypothetical protein